MYFAQRPIFENSDSDVGNLTSHVNFETLWIHPLNESIFAKESPIFFCNMDDILLFSEFFKLPGGKNWKKFTSKTQPRK